MKNSDHNLKLEPGFELDKLIAEKVLGWKKSTWPGLWIDDICKQIRLSDFSTDIKVAWDLAEKFRLCVMPFGKNGWAAVKKWNDDEMIVLQNSAPTAPHAICLAALFYTNEDDE